jgi:hypothetical protein
MLNQCYPLTDNIQWFSTIATFRSERHPLLGLQPHEAQTTASWPIRIPMTAHIMGWFFMAIAIHLLFVKVHKLNQANIPLDWFAVLTALKSTHLFCLLTHLPEGRLQKRSTNLT